MGGARGLLQTALAGHFVAGIQHTITRLQMAAPRLPGSPGTHGSPPGSPLGGLPGSPLGGPLGRPLGRPLEGLPSTKNLSPCLLKRDTILLAELHYFALKRVIAFTKFHLMLH